VDLLSKARSADQIRIDKLSNENAAMQEQLKALGVKPAVSGGEPAPHRPLRLLARKASRSLPVIRRSQAQRYRLRRHFIRAMV
jgi:hypothetical protein